MIHWYINIMDIIGVGILLLGIIGAFIYISIDERIRKYRHKKGLNGK